MRPDKLLMVGVVALGGIFTWRLFFGPGPRRDELPEAPGPMRPPPETLPLLTGSALNMRQGQWYRGRFEADPSASRAKLEAGLRAMGFGDGDRTRVFLSTDEPGNLTPDFAKDAPGRGTRWFYARWSTPSRPIGRPAGLVAIWNAFSPELSAARGLS